MMALGVKTRSVQGSLKGQNRAGVGNQPQYFVVGDGWLESWFLVGFSHGWFLVGFQLVFGWFFGWFFYGPRFFSRILNYILL